MLLFFGENGISPFISVKKIFELIDKKRKLLVVIKEANKILLRIKDIFENEIDYINFIHYIIT